MGQTGMGKARSAEDYHTAFDIRLVRLIYIYIIYCTYINILNIDLKV